jgi:hypothetical protein
LLRAANPYAQRAFTAVRRRRAVDQHLLSRPLNRINTVQIRKPSQIRFVRGERFIVLTESDADFLLCTRALAYHLMIDLVDRPYLKWLG